MGKSSKKSINSNSARPARRARRGAAASEPVAAAPVAAEPAADAAPAADAPAAEPLAVTEVAPAAAPSRREVQQLAFHYYAESGYVNGNALDHWLRAETELGNG